MNNSEQFNKEIKELLSGNIIDEDVRNYLAIKITRLYEKYVNDICERQEKPDIRV